MAELADARDLKSRGGNIVPVRSRSPAERLITNQLHKRFIADVAQLAEQLICNQQVIGSSPIIGFLFCIGVWLSLARAPGLGPGGRRFESCHPDFKFIKYAGVVQW